MFQITFISINSSTNKHANPSILSFWGVTPYKLTGKHRLRETSCLQLHPLSVTTQITTTTTTTTTTIIA
jgi:hypothetical protein